MNRFLSVPQLPKYDVASVALGARYLPALRSALEREGVRCIPLPDNPAVDPRLCGHADLSLLHLGSRDFLMAAELSETALTELSPAISKVPTYLNEDTLNVALVGRKAILFGKTAYIPEGFERIDVRQRYARCSVCIVDENSIITADRGIEKACRGKLDVLLIEAGYVELPGYEYGFIGGASFKLGKNVLAFTGTLRQHPDAERIESYLRERGVEPLYLTEQVSFDCGSAVLITEKKPFSAPLY